MKLIFHSVELGTFTSREHFSEQAQSQLLFTLYTLARNHFKVNSSQSCHGTLKFAMIAHNVAQPTDSSLNGLLLLAQNQELVRTYVDFEFESARLLAKNPELVPEALEQALLAKPEDGSEPPAKKVARDQYPRWNMVNVEFLHALYRIQFVSKPTATKTATCVECPIRLDNMDTFVGPLKEFLGEFAETKTNYTPTAALEQFEDVATLVTFDDFKYFGSRTEKYVKANLNFNVLQNPTNAPLIYPAKISFDIRALVRTYKGSANASGTSLDSGSENASQTAVDSIAVIPLVSDERQQELLNVFRGLPGGGLVSNLFKTAKNVEWVARSDINTYVNLGPRSKIFFPSGLNRIIRGQGTEFHNYELPGFSDDLSKFDSPNNNFFDLFSCYEENKWLSCAQPIFGHISNPQEINRLVDRIIASQTPFTRDFFASIQKEVSTFVCSSRAMEVRSLPIRYADLQKADGNALEKAISFAVSDYNKAMSRISGLVKSIKGKSTPEETEDLRVEETKKFFSDSTTVERVRACVREMVTLNDINKYLNAFCNTLDKKTVYALVAVTPSSLNTSLKQVVRYIIPYALDDNENRTFC